jgi:uncharacterized membrane protein YraQ (UPF0718 family)
MAIIRPVAAFFSALFAGILQLTFNKTFEFEKEDETKKPCCSKTKASSEKLSFAEKIKLSFKYAFGDLIDDIAFWLLIGLVLGSLITVFVPNDFFMNMDVSQSRFLILLLGVPLYICASATTPIAAALVLKGASPGTALLLLLVGPATNLSNIAVLQKYIGKKGVMLNVISIVFVALIFSYITDFLYGNYFDVSWASLGHSHEEHIGILSKISGVFILALIVKGIYIEKLKPKSHSH